MFVWMVVGFGEAATGVLIGAYGYSSRLPMVEHVEHDVTAGMQMQIHFASALWYFLLATPLGWLAMWLFCEGRHPLSVRDGDDAGAAVARRRRGRTPRPAAATSARPAGSC